jgi:fumarate reductase subunit D
MVKNKQVKIEKANMKSSKDLDVEINKNMAALSYAWILCFIPFLFKRDSEFVQFHAKQGVTLFIIILIASLFVWFPVFGPLFMFGLVIVSVLGVVKTLNGEWWKIPFIYEQSKKIKF